MTPVHVLRSSPSPHIPLPSMSRSLKKGPYVNERLLKKVMAQMNKGEKKIIKTWARDCDIPPEFVGFTFAVHNGKEFLPVHGGKMAAAQSAPQGTSPMAGGPAPAAAAPAAPKK